MQQPFPVLTHAQAAATFTQEPVDQMAKEAARRIARPIRIALLVLLFPFVVVTFLWTWTDGWWGFARAFPIGIAIVALIVLKGRPTASRFALTFGLDQENYTYATTFGPDYADFAIHGAALTRIHYSDIKRVTVLSSVVLVRRRAPVVHLIPRNLVPADALMRIRLMSAPTPN